MRCPRCNYEGDLVEGGCARCGYGRRRVMPETFSGANPGANQARVIQRPPITNTLSRAGRRTPVPRQLSPVSRQLSPTTQPLLRSDILHQGRYILRRQIILPTNQQKQGRAWLAVDAQHPDTVVVVREVIPPEGSTAAAAQIVREAALRMSQLGQRAGFPKVLDMFSERGTTYLVMEHMEGKSLAQLMQEHGPLPERTVAEYGRQLCGVLEELAIQNPPVIHGSINPETVMVTLNGKQAFLAHIPLFPPENVSPGNEKASTGYLAPEQVRGKAEPASDQYGLAATLYHALTGYDPDKHMSFFFPPVRRLNPIVSPRMESILSQALRLSLTQRYSRASQMQREFDIILTTTPAPGPNNPGFGETDIARRLEIMRGRERRNNSLTVLLFAIVSALVLFLLIGGILLSIYRAPGAAATAVSATATVQAVQTANALQAAQVKAAWNSELALEKQTFTKSGVGISDGHYVFDAFSPQALPGLPCNTNVDCKVQAASALNKGDLNTAATLFAQAFTIGPTSGIGDPTDAEARIYNANVNILLTQLPYVSIVLGVDLNGSSEETLQAARSELQAAFVAQYEINEFALLPHHLLLRVLIANTGSNPANVSTVAQFIATRVTRAGNPDHIIAVVGGWASSVQTLNARAIITGAQIPFISEIASDVKLGAGNAYTFHINPLYDTQASALATVAGQLGAKRIFVLRDPNNPDSVSLADQFGTQAKALSLTVLPNSAVSFVEGSTSVDGYQPIVQDIVSQHADLIFLAGTDVDAVRLAHAVGLASRADPANSTLANLKILGGTSFDSNLLVGQGSGLDAIIAHSNPQDMQRLNFIAFADANELTALKPVPNSHPPFFNEWSGLYQNSLSNPVENALPPDQVAIMTYDAFDIVGYAASSITGAETGQAVRDGLHLFGSGKHSPFAGISGQVVFDNQGNPTNKALALLTV
ncbi:MAG TPA: bifunctional serine/threonine-protein kinase/ABC transporter substrate-binding protein, partial [Ktedonobacteraceae bacterium]|nr:bifunctional serine/threonine-protein kinase/ABC transporter substrate-binding protein [Ktedonobacteraceae bacterium]